MTSRNVCCSLRILNINTSLSIWKCVLEKHIDKYMLNILPLLTFFLRNCMPTYKQKQTECIMLVCSIVNKYMPWDSMAYLPRIIVLVYSILYSNCS